MKRMVKSVYIIFSVTYILYLLLPNPAYPIPPSDSLQSQEPADTETFLRRAYFINYDRNQTLDHYQSQFKLNSFQSLRIPTLRLNYPPEEAQTIIRDQTRSTYLEELAHPFRESVFINGFIPAEKKDAIFIEGKLWYQKITVRSVPSDTLTRILIGLATLTLIPLIYISLSRDLSGLKGEISKKWTFR